MKSAALLVVMAAFTLLLCGCGHEANFERYMKEGVAAYEKPDFKKASEFFSLASVEAQHLKKEDPRRFMVLWKLGDARRRAAFKAEAADAFKKALALRPEGPPSARADAMEQLAQLMVEAGDAGEAIAMLEAAIKEMDSGSGKGSPEAGRLKSELGLVLQSEGDYKAAIAALSEAMEILESNTGTGHDQARTLQGLAACYQSIGQDDRAIELSERAKGLEQSAIGGQVEKLKPRL